MKIPENIDGVKLAPIRHNEKGEEILDPTVIEPPLGYQKTPSLAEQIAQQVRRMKLELLQDDSIAETEEEADDFEVEDDMFPASYHENDHIPKIGELKRRAKAINDAIREENRKAAIAAHEKALKQPPSPRAQPADNNLTSPKEPSQ